MALSQEQPPPGVDEALREYLIRFRTDIDSELRKASKFPERKEMPYKPQSGDIHYFGDPADHNYDAAITTEGFWGLRNGTWRRLDLDGGGGGGAVDSVTGGTNINVTGTAVDPIVNLDAAISGVSVNGVTLDDGGVATNYLDETGNYSQPPGSNLACAGALPFFNQDTTQDNIDLDGTEVPFFNQDTTQDNITVVCA